jgi:uncharacterized membrane protein YcjF (UPF0283 family)
VLEEQEVRQLVVQVQEEQQQVQMEVIQPLHQALELRFPLQAVVVVEQVMLLMVLMEALVVGVQVDLQQQAVLLPHQGKVTQVEQVVALLLVQIILEELVAVVQVQQVVPLQQQTIQPMEQVE